MHSLKFALAALALALAGLFLPAFTSSAFAQSCTSDGSGRCCLGGVSTTIVKKGRFQTNGKGYSKGEEHHSYAVKIPNSCNVPLVVVIEFDCRFSGQIIPGEDRIPPGGKVNRYDVLRPGCQFNVWEKVKGKRAELPSAQDLKGNRTAQAEAARKQTKNAQKADQPSEESPFLHGGKLTKIQQQWFNRCRSPAKSAAQIYDESTRDMAKGYSGNNKRAYINARKQLRSESLAVSDILNSDPEACYLMARYGNNDGFERWKKTANGRKWLRGIKAQGDLEMRLIYDNKQVRSDDQIKADAQWAKEKRAIDERHAKKRGGAGQGTDGVCAWSTQKCKALGLQ